MRYGLASFLICSCAVLAQEPVAPSSDPVGPARGDTWSGYNIVNSFEAGYRFVTLSGDGSNYRSASNLGDGIRLLDTAFSINSKEGHGTLFDDAFLTTEGLGGDPYEFASFRIEKNRLYSYSANWRSSQYVNPGLITDGGGGIHSLDTEYRSQDHNLTLFPESAIRVFLGYSRDTQGGSGISTDQVFTGSNTTFPLFTNVKRQRNEYRIGNELHWHRTVLVWTRAWADFKDDSAYSLSASPTASFTGSDTTLTAFNRTAPFHGTSPYWTAALFRDGSFLNVNGRFTYTSGEGAFLASEGATGVNSFLLGENSQFNTFGQGKRPIATGNLTLSLTPSSKLTLTSDTAIYNVRSEGNNAFIQIDNLSQASNILYFQSLGIRTVATDAEAAYQLRPWLQVNSGYEYSNRRIESVEDTTLVQGAFSSRFSQTNELHSGNAGVRINPWKALSISVDGELGRSSQPFTPKGDGDYHTVRGAASYRSKHFQLSTWVRDDRNATSVSLSAFTAHSRTWAASGSWLGNAWLSIDAGYSKLHVDTLGGINFFADATQFANQFSYYVSNLHTANLGVRLTPPRNRVTLFIGGSLAKDTGDGRQNALDTSKGPAIPAFEAAQTFPLEYLSPVARLTLRINERLRWNAGYQLFDYQAMFSPGINFAARTGYTSVSWSF